MSAAGKQHPAGFTLFEMLVVLAILGLIGGLVYPALQRSVQSQTLRATAAAIATALREGRARAQVIGRPVAVIGDGGGLRVGSGAPGLLPGSLQVETAPATGVLFYPDGSANGGEITISDRHRSIHYTVSPTTGLLRLTAG